MLIKTKNIIGIFDLDTTTISKKTRDFLKINQNKGNIINSTNDLPKSFIIYKNKDKKYDIIINKLSSKIMINNVENSSKYYCF